MYVPNADLGPFHDRSPWLMFPRSFAESGYASTLICGRLTGERPAGIRIVETALMVKDPRQGGFFRSLAEPFFAFPEIVRQKPDIVMVGPLRSSLLTVFPLVAIYRRISPRRRTTFVLKADWSLDPTGLSPVEFALSKILLVASTFFFDLVSMETSCGVRRAGRLPGIRSRRVICVPLALPQGRIEGATYEGFPRTPVILCVGRIARMKGQDVLVDAFGQLASRYPGWSIRLIGPVDDPVFEEEIRTRASRQGVSDRVHLLGFLGQTEMDREFHAASIFCLPSVHSENAGQVKYEATASGLPVVATDIPCAPDATEMGWRVARAGDVADLAARLEELMRDAGERARVAHLAQSKQRSYVDLVRMYQSAAGRASFEP
jgi:glycosyltransferase involved in cell wall biosynthesis